MKGAELQPNYKLGYKLTPLLTQEADIQTVNTVTLKI